jgi:hypothetical protein
VLERVRAPVAIPQITSRELNRPATTYHLVAQLVTSDHLVLIGGSMLGYGLAGTIVVVLLIVVLVRGL